MEVADYLFARLYGALARALGARAVRLLGLTRQRKPPSRIGLTT